MRCSASEARFEALLDGRLSAPQRRLLDAHLDRCARCRGILEELRVIDALLLTPRRLEPAPNFTFKTMAEIRSMPPPKPMRPRFPLWMLFAFYLAASWTGIGAWLAFGRPDAHAVLAVGVGIAQHVAGAVAGIAHALSGGFGYGYSGVAGAVAVVLILDLAAMAAVLFLALVVRPRLLRRLVENESG
jgi:anti-sigma factor RsiW